MLTTAHVPLPDCTACTMTLIKQGYPGGPAAVPDWTPRLGADPAHPEYPSGHAVTVGAALEVLRRFLGTDNVSTYVRLTRPMVMH